MSLPVLCSSAQPLCNDRCVAIRCRVMRPISLVAVAYGVTDRLIRLCFKLVLLSSVKNDEKETISDRVYESISGKNGGGCFN